MAKYAFITDRKNLVAYIRMTELIPEQNSLNRRIGEPRTTFFLQRGEILYII
jgi:hypothetical protein